MIDMYCKKFPKIKDVIPLENGVFGHMNYTFPETINVTKEQLDYLFMSSFGRRNPAPVIDLLHDEDADEDEFSQLTSAELTKLASMMLAYFKHKWDRLGEIYAIEYDPIHNYLDDWEDEADGTRGVDGTIDRDISDTLNTSVTHTNTRTDNLIAEEEHDMRNDNTREFENEDTTYYNSQVEHEIPVSHPMTETTQYGKTDERIDATVKTNTGTEATVNSGTDTNSVWGFNSSNAVNSDSTTRGTTAEHVIDPHDPLVEENSGTVTHNYGGSDVVTKYGSDVEEKTGNDRIAHDGTITDENIEFGTVTTTNTGTQTSAGSDATTGTNTRAVDETNSVDEETHKERRGRHFGNIGNLTSQKMIQEEIELWKWNYIQSILEDARDFLTLPVYL